jgi:hypothetical protein
MKRFTKISKNAFLLSLFAYINAPASPKKDSNFMSCILPLEVKLETNVRITENKRIKDSTETNNLKKKELQKFIRQLEVGSALLTPISAVLIITLFVLLL